MSLYDNIQNEPVSRLALRTPVLAAPDDTLEVVIQRLRKAELGCCIVVDEARKPLGLFTEKCLPELLPQLPERLQDPVEGHMIRPFPWVSATDPISDVLEAMRVRNTRYLCVVDEQGQVCGLTGQKSLMEFFAEHFPGQVMVQRLGGSPTIHEREGA